MTIAIKACASAGMGILLLAGGAFAQLAPAPAPQTGQTETVPRATTPRAADTQRAEGPATGANSFTERQAQSRITDAGYTEVMGMTQGGDGVWRGRAMRNGAPEDVALDYRGEVFGGAAARASAPGTSTGNTAAPAPRR